MCHCSELVLTLTLPVKNIKSFSSLLLNTFACWLDHCLVSICLSKLINNPESFSYTNKFCDFFFSRRYLNPLKWVLQLIFWKSLDPRKKCCEWCSNSQFFNLFQIQIIILACLLCQKVQSSIWYFLWTFPLHPTCFSVSRVISCSISGLRLHKSYLRSISFGMMQIFLS